MDIAAFIEARLAEDERHARAAGWHRWEVGDMTTVVATGNGKVVAGVGFDYDARFIARHDPARVLREVEAIRRLLEGHRQARAAWDAAHAAELASRDEHNVMALDAVRATNAAWAVLRVWYDGVLCPVALAWADHPDYYPGWRP